MTPARATRQLVESGTVTRARTDHDTPVLAVAAALVDQLVERVVLAVCRVAHAVDTVCAGTVARTAQEDALERVTAWRTAQELALLTVTTCRTAHVLDSEPVTATRALATFHAVAVAVVTACRTAQLLAFVAGATVVRTDHAVC